MNGIGCCPIPAMIGSPVCIHTPRQLRPSELSIETFTPTDTTEHAQFSVFGDIDSRSLPRVLELFAKPGSMPDSIHTNRREGVRAIGISLSGMDADLATYIGRCLREIYVV